MVDSIFSSPLGLLKGKRRRCFWCFLMSLWFLSMLKHLSNPEYLNDSKGHVKRKLPNGRDYADLDQMTNVSNASISSWYHNHALHNHTGNAPAGAGATTSSVVQHFRKSPTRLNTTDVSNLRLVYMGDSVTRYQYMSMVSYIHTGHWNTTHVTPTGKVQDLTNKNTFDDMAAMNTLAQQVFAQQETCDCYRSKINRKPVYTKTLRENRFYADSAMGNYVSFIAKFGTAIPSRGLLRPDNVHNSNTNNPMFNNVSTTFTWMYKEWKDVIREFLAKINPPPRYFVFNAGIWPHDLHDETVLRGIRDALTDSGMQGIYKTTTKALSNKNPTLMPHDAMACEIFPCLYLNWTAHATKRDYVDELHFAQGVYHQMNQQLLALIHRLERENEGSSYR